MFLKPVIIHCCVIWLDRKHCRWTCAMTTLYIDICLHRQYRKTSFICCLIVTAKNLIWPMIFFIFLFMVTSRGIIFICSADLTFVVDSMTSNLSLISDRHNINQHLRNTFLFEFLMSLLFLDINFTAFW